MLLIMDPSAPLIKLSELGQSLQQKFFYLDHDEPLRVSGLNKSGFTAKEEAAVKNGPKALFLNTSYWTFLPS